MSLAVALGAAPVPAAAGSSRLEPPDGLASLGLERHVTEWPELTAGSRAEAARRLDPDANAALQRALDAGFDPARLRADLEARLRADPVLGGGAGGAGDAGNAGGGSGPLAAVAGFAASPLARTLAAARERAARPAGLHAFPAFASDLQARRVPAARMDAARAIDRETRLTAHAGALALRIGRAAVRGTQGLRCRPARFDSPAETRERERLSRLLGPFQERVWAWLLFQYRDVPPADLARYLDFLESDAARAFHAALERHHAETLDAAMERFRAALLPAVQRRCARAPR